MENTRKSALEISKEEFRKIGHQLIDDLADFIDSIDERPVTPNESPGQLKNLLGNSQLPNAGKPAAELITKATELLLNHSLLNGHPKFFGYITSSAAPIGAFADLLAASVNPNVGAHILSPIATEIEKQTIGWLAEFIGVSPSYGGLLVSGGNMANFTAFLAARTAKAPKATKEEGIASTPKRFTVYCATTTHTWVEKAAILFGLGTKAVRWIQTDASNKMDTKVLETTIAADLKDDFKPIMVIGTAGDVSTGVVDNLEAIATVCKKHDLWFHIDGAYGVPAAVVPKYNYLFDGIKDADSIALDPHKWLYSPLEAGCTLVKNPQHLIDTYSSHPEYYNFGNEGKERKQNFYEYGLQNSRGFRALKVWLALQQVGRSGYEKLISEDIELSQMLFDLAEKHPELEAVSQNLSIATFRYLPLNSNKSIDYLNAMNEALLNELQAGGQVFISNAIVDKKYCLRACIVNFRTSQKDIKDIIEIIIHYGRKLNSSLR
ncbi:aminotransferase class V-fold PLP-dependent enzyme [uncultured Cyclobacterium sp.]|uniref:pyridoxal phosphate-dependent decarboxylase family protein n=1 Tax=uncultured Cyclobacterium sp. TaxID=453820 RepID=UPI0030EEA1E1|tara:strand:- start:23426 stop:24898 length:1473 start_codon:yes stop_codon:yes gene_type:complete